jgi:hypothetical protein
MLNKLPIAAPLWSQLAAGILHPEPATQLEADRPERFVLHLPGAKSAKLQAYDSQTATYTASHLEVVSFEMDCDSITQVASAEIILPRRPALELLVQLEGSSGWQKVLHWCVHRERQAIIHRPDCNYLIQQPDQRHPMMKMVCSALSLDCCCAIAVQSHLALCYPFMGSRMNATSTRTSPKENQLKAVTPSCKHKRMLTLATVLPTHDRVNCTSCDISARIKYMLLVILTRTEV